mmetsp:Transcript_22587/g.57579  ORF Transcript_22587/g.57579 Transcript_22587/m.57579 type:complete len:217 (+) Transcript_22587:65-715(+)
MVARRPPCDDRCAHVERGGEGPFHVRRGALVREDRRQLCCDRRADQGVHGLGGGRPLRHCGGAVPPRHLRAGAFVALAREAQRPGRGGQSRDARRGPSLPCRAAKAGQRRRFRGDVQGGQDHLAGPDGEGQHPTADADDAQEPLALPPDAGAGVPPGPEDPGGHRQERPQAGYPQAGCPRAAPEATASYRAAAARAVHRQGSGRLGAVPGAPDAAT